MALTGGGIGFTTTSPTPTNFHLFSSVGDPFSSTNLSDYAFTDIVFAYSDGSIIGGSSASSVSLTQATPVPFDFDPSFGLLALGGAWTVRKMIKKSKNVVNK